MEKTGDVLDDCRELSWEMGGYGLQWFRWVTLQLMTKAVPCPS
jgi:hypothetical protein